MRRRGRHDTPPGDRRVRDDEPRLAARLRVSLVLSIALIALALLGLEAPALAVGAVGAPGFALGGLWFGARRRRAQAREHLAKGALYALVLAVGLGAGLAHDRTARANAAEIIAALERHADAHGGYPEGLAALAPGELPAVPSPSGKRLGQQGFLYRRVPDGYVLGYRAFGVTLRLYDSRDGAWRVRE